MAGVKHTEDLFIGRHADGLEVDLDPLQGYWTQEQYLRLTDGINTLIEFTDGMIEVLPMPTEKHQNIIALIYELLKAFIQPLGGKVVFAALRLQIQPGKFREPDVLLLRDKADPRRQDRYWLGADLVVEVVSPDRPERDLVDKVVDYAEGGIPEYWIINPEDETVTVYALVGDAYAAHGVYRRGDAAASRLLDGFGVSVDLLFDVE